LLIGTFGAASTFVPLMADISRWFERRRGIAVALCASGNYISGAFWPPVVDYLIQTMGWRAAHFWIGLFCVALMVPLALLLRAPAPVRAMNAPPLPTVFSRATNLPPGLLQALLAIAGFACCVAMSMPQVHIVAYCGDLGYGVANGARMLSLMLGFGIVSRIASGFVADRLGGMATLAIGSAAQMTALTLVSDERRAGVAVRDLGDVRIVPGWAGAQLRDRDPGEFSGERGRRPGRVRHDDDVARDGAWRVDVRGDLRS
jgi:MFS family permease